LPKELLNHSFWKGQPNPTESKMTERMQQLWGDRFK